MHPTLIHLGPIPVRSYGVMVLAGFLLGLWYAMAAARRRLAARGPNAPGRVTPDHIFDMSLIALFVAIVFSRLLYVLLDMGEFRSSPAEAFKIWTGGVSIHGALLGGILTVWWYCRRHRLPFLVVADLCAPAFALGYAIGRVGCFLNGCCYGHACDLPWAVQFMRDGRPGSWTPPSHPTQLYATLLNLGFFVLLDRLLRRPHRDGQIFLGYLALYSVYRFVDEQFRKGATADILAWGMTHAQVFSLISLPVLLFFLWRIHRAPAPPASEPAAPLPPSTVEG